MAPDHVGREEAIGAVKVLESSLTETHEGDIPALSKTSEGKAAEVESLIAPTLASMGYEIVRVMIMGAENKKTLQIMAERLDGEVMTVDDCADISRAVEAILDVEDPIEGAYSLEASSAGIDRPLTRLSDFVRFAGFDAKVELQAAVEGRKRYSGRLLGVEGENIRIEVDGEEYSLPFRDMAKAKLLLTDELIAHYQSGE